MTDAIDETPPLPVPGFEHLVWRDTAVQVPADGANFKPVLVGRGVHAGVVFVAGGIRAATIEDPFGAWPPRVRTPTVITAYLDNELGGRPPRVAPWGEDELVIQLGEAYVGRWDEAGARALGLAVPRRSAFDQPLESVRPYVGSTREHGVYVVRSVREEGGGPLSCSLEHRRADALDAPVKLGDLPDFPPLRAVLADGSFLFAIARPPKGAPRRKRPPRPKDPPIYLDVEIFRATREGIASCGLLPKPFETNATEIVPAPSGGAWVTCLGPKTEAVLRLDASGRAVGEPWFAPYPRGGAYRSFVTAWREGFLFITERALTRDGPGLGPVTILATDGAHTTRVSATHPDHNMDDWFSALPSPDGRSILVAHSYCRELRLVRADFDGAAPRDAPWDIDRARVKRVAERAAAHATAPPRLPGRPIETTSDGTPPPRLHARERIIERARLRHVLTTLWCLHHDLTEPTRFADKNGEGGFMHHDGSGNFTFLAWNAAGLVAGGFDGDKPAPGDDDPDTKSPEQCFPDVPAKLAPLVAQIIQTSGGRLTGGLWVTTGEGARHNEEGEVHDDFPRYTMTADAALTAEGCGLPWGIDLAPWGAIAARLAERASAGPYAITAEDEEELLRPRALPMDGDEDEASPGRSDDDDDMPPDQRAPLDERRLLFAARSLAAAGISWPAGEARGRAALAAHAVDETETGGGRSSS